MAVAFSCAPRAVLRSLLFRYSTLLGSQTAIPWRGTLDLITVSQISIHLIHYFDVCKGAFTQLMSSLPSNFRCESSQNVVFKTKSPTSFITILPKQTLCAAHQPLCASLGLLLPRFFVGQDTHAVRICVESILSQRFDILKGFRMGASGHSSLGSRGRIWYLLASRRSDCRWSSAICENRKRCYSRLGIKNFKY